MQRSKSFLVKNLGYVQKGTCWTSVANHTFANLLQMLFEVSRVISLDICKNKFFIFLLSLIFILNLEAQESSVFDIARSGSLLEIKELVKHDSNIINVISEKGYSALTLACYYSNNEVASYLIKHVKDINSKSSYGTPLMAATVKKNIYLVKKDIRSFCYLY